ncbi:sterile alpha motif domain-containing protein 9-like [Glandiceps talaboti]
MPSDPRERQDWCRERLHDRRQWCLRSQNIQIISTLKKPKRKRQYHGDTKTSQNTSFRMLKPKFQGKGTLTTPAKSRSLQLFIFSDFITTGKKTPVVLSVSVGATVTSVKKMFRKEKGMSSIRNLYITTSKGFKLCDALTMEDHGIENDANLYMKSTDSCLKGGADTGEPKKIKTRKKGKREDLDTEARGWSKEDVRRWLTRTGLDKKYVDRLFDEEVDGETLLLYTKEDLAKDFEIKIGPSMKLQNDLEQVRDLIPSSKRESATVSLPVDIDTWTIDHVEKWLSSLTLERKYIRKIKEEEVNGSVLKLFNPKKIVELENEFDMRKGPLRKLLYHVQALVNDDNTGIDDDKPAESSQKSNTSNTLSTYELTTSPLKLRAVSNERGAESLLPSEKSSDNPRRDDRNNDQAITVTQRVCQENEIDRKMEGCSMDNSGQEPLPLDKSMKEYVMLLRKNAFLDISQVQSKTGNVCSLHLLYSKWGKEENILERQFSFIILKMGEELNKIQIVALWEQIQRNVKHLITFLPDKEKALFDLNAPSKKGAVLLANNKQEVTLRSKGLKSCLITQKNLTTIAKHTINIVIVDNGMVTAKGQCYKAYIGNNSYPQLLFDESCPFVASFDPCNAKKINFQTAEEFRKKKRGHASETKTIKIEGELGQNQEGPRKKTEEFVMHSIKPTDDKTGSPGPEPADTISAPNPGDFDKGYQSQLPIDREKPVITNPNSNKSRFRPASDDEILRQRPRLFDREIESCTYVYRRVLDVIETGPKDLMQPVHEYKQFTDYGKYERIYRSFKFTRETLRFACACLNDRSNGTIHFGIADNKSGHYVHGEILGFEVADKTEYEEDLNNSITRGFEKREIVDIVRKCVRPPRFIPVTNFGSKKKKYAIEVDIVPHSTYCANNAFFVKLPRDPTEQKNQKRNLEQAALYRRIGSSSVKIEGQEMQDFIRSHLSGLVVRRKEADAQTSSAYGDLSVRKDNLAKKLTWLLCTGQSTLDSSFYPILIINQPHSRDIIWTQMRFIIEIDWVAIFDFDADSQKDGVCAMYSEHKIPNIQDPDMYLNIKDTCTFRDDIDFPEKTSWIFANGRSKLDHKALNRVEWNMDISRSRGVKEAIRFFANEDVIPKRRAIVVFLLLSQDYDVMLEVFSEFSTYFTPERLMCIAEDDYCFSGWAKEIVDKTCTREVLQSRSVVGMPLQHVNETILLMKGIQQDTKCTIPSSTGAPVTLPQRDKNTLRDLEILSINECEEEAKGMTYRERINFQRGKELLFYQGHSVEWWNLWATDHSFNHVLKRDKHDELKKHIHDALNLVSSEEIRRVSKVFLFHQPGAGGTTMARHILWEFKKYYRCVVINRVTSDTANQLLKLWSYKEWTQDCKPILACVEELDEMVFRELQIRIDETWVKKGYVNLSNKPVCILLHCKRYISNDPSKKNQHHFESVTLEHALTEGERLWFVRKLDELNDKSEDLEEFDPRHLISFMILKENFNHEYVESVVTSIIKEVVKGSPESRLLKYVALLNTYVFESSLAVACCDALMGFSHFTPNKNVRKEGQYIEFLLSPPTKLLLIEMQKVSLGSVKAFKIVHPLVAKEVLKQMMLWESQSLGAATLEYLESELFKTSSHAKEDLGRMTTEMLKRRKKYEYGDDCETKFSPLIEEMVKTGHEDEATKVLLYGMQLFKDDAMMTQQVARLYLHRKEFEEAKKFAEKAVKIKPGNSYLLDTLGEIYKEQMNSDYEHVKIKQTKLDPSEAINGIHLGFRAIEVFEESQRAAMHERYTQNTVGYIKEVETCFRLMEILLCVEPFRKPLAGMELLHKYLVKEEFTPEPVAMPWAQYHKKFKSLRISIEKAIEWMTDYCTVYKEDYFFEHSYFQRMKTKLYEFNSKYAHYFGEKTNEMPTDIREPSNANEWRRLRVSALGCNRFRNIFAMVQDFKKGKTGFVKEHVCNIFLAAKKLLMENEPRNAFDLHCLISLNLALSNLDKNQKGVTSIDRVYDMTKLYIQITHSDSLYPYYFLSMLMWPRENSNLPYDASILDDAIQNLKSMFGSKQKDRPEGGQLGKNKRIPITQCRLKPTTLFFLGKESGLRAFIHTSDLQLSGGGNLEFKGDRFWESARVRTRLKRLRGVVWSHNQIRACDVLNEDKATIEILTSIPFKSVSSRETVSFYLGFSLSGPVAYHISTRLDSEEFDDDIQELLPVPNGQAVIVESPSKDANEYLEYRSKHSKLTRDLTRIGELRKLKKSGCKLEKNQIEKMEKEREIRQLLSNLEEEYEMEMKTNPDFLTDYY